MYIFNWIPWEFFLSFLQEVYSVYRILTGILNTGNIEFAAISSQHQTDKSEVPNPEALENGNYILIWSTLQIPLDCICENLLTCGNRLC